MTMRIENGEPVWIVGGREMRERALDAKRRAETKPPAPLVVERVVDPEPVSRPVEKPKQVRKPKAFARARSVTHADKVGFRDSAEPDESVELQWQSTKRRETTVRTRVALGLMVIIPALLLLGLRGGVVWLFVAACVGFAIAAFRQRPEKLARHSVRVSQREIVVDDRVIPRVRVEGVEVRSSDEDGLHRVVLKGAEVVVDETAKLEHARWIEDELKRELDATE